MNSTELEAILRGLNEVGKRHQDSGVGRPPEFMHTDLCEVADAIERHARELAREQVVSNLKRINEEFRTVRNTGDDGEYPNPDGLARIETYALATGCVLVPRQLLEQVAKYPIETRPWRLHEPWEVAIREIRQLLGERK